MKAVYVPVPHKLEIAELDKPTAGEGQILVRVRAAGICGSDMHIYHGTNALAKYPRIIGHEFAGEVAEVGAGVSGFSVGEHVCVDPVVACGHCYACRIGRHNVCRNLEVIGVHRDGGMREFAAVPAANVYKIPDDWAFEKGALVEPFSIGANATSRGECHEGDMALVMGAGPIGLTILQAAKALGATVAVADIIDSRLDAAKKMGADYTVNSKTSDLEAAMLEWTKGEGVPLTFDAVCIPALFPPLLRMASPAGRVVHLGFSTQAAEMMPLEVTKKELTIVGTRLNRGMFPRVIDWFKRGVVHPEGIVSHSFPFEKVMDAVKLIEDKPLETCKVTLKF